MSNGETNARIRTLLAVTTLLVIITIAVVLGIFTFLLSVVLFLVIVVVAFLVLLLSVFFLLVITIFLVLVALVLSGASTVFSFPLLFPIVGCRDPNIQRSQHRIQLAMDRLLPVQILTVTAFIVSTVADVFIAIASLALSIVVVFIGVAVVLSMARSDKRSTVDSSANCTYAHVSIA